MKVFIGPYREWWGPYQITELLKYVGVPESVYHDKIGAWLAHTWVADFCQWIENKKKRKIKIRIDNYDTWSMDHTLSLIILPMIKKLRECKHGSPIVDNEDVPVHLQCEEDKMWDDEYIHIRWEWILDEIIWAFEELNRDDWLQDYYGKGKSDKDGADAHQARITKGLTLFGRYYQGLWD